MIQIDPIPWTFSRNVIPLVITCMNDSAIVTSCPAIEVCVIHKSLIGRIGTKTRPKTICTSSMQIHAPFRAILTGLLAPYEHMLGVACTLAVDSLGQTFLGTIIIFADFLTQPAGNRTILFHVYLVGKSRCTKAGLSPPSAFIIQV